MSMVLRSLLGPVRPPRFSRVISVRSISDKKFVQVTLDKETNVSTLSLARPPVNAMSIELMGEIVDTITELEQNGSAGLIITSALPSIYSAGLDIPTMYKPDLVKLTLLWSGLQDVWSKLYGCAIPTVAAINGTSPAGGCLLALSCDYRIMVSNKRFRIGLNEVELGVAIPPFVYKTMANVLGQRQTELALTTARMFTTDEALAAGLVDRLAVDKEDALKKAAEFFESMAHIQFVPRVMTKQRFRGDALRWMAENKKDDLEMNVNFISSAPVQAVLQAYFDGLKKKKK